MIKVPVVNESSNELPEYATPKSAGFDFRADTSKVKEKFTWNCVLSYKEDGTTYLNLLAADDIYYKYNFSSIDFGITGGFAFKSYKN